MITQNTLISFGLLCCCIEKLYQPQRPNQLCQTRAVAHLRPNFITDMAWLIAVPEVGRSLYGLQLANAMPSVAC